MRFTLVVLAGLLLAGALTLAPAPSPAADATRVRVALALAAARQEAARLAVAGRDAARPAGPAASAGPDMPDMPSCTCGQECACEGQRMRCNPTVCPTVRPAASSPVVVPPRPAGVWLRDHLGNWHWLP